METEFLTKSTGRFRKKFSRIRHLEESQEDSQIPDKEGEWPIVNLNLPNSLAIVEIEGESLDMEVVIQGLQSVLLQRKFTDRYLVM